MMFVVVVVVVGSKAIHKHFTFMPKMRLQSEWEKWGANLKHTQKETRVQWHQNQSQSSCQKKLFSYAYASNEVWMLWERDINTFDILFICITSRVFWDVINVDTRLEDLRGITAIIIIINIIALQHTQTSNFWFLQRRSKVI